MLISFLLSGKSSNNPTLLWGVWISNSKVGSVQGNLPCFCQPVYMYSLRKGGILMAYNYKVRGQYSRKRKKPYTTNQQWIIICVYALSIKRGILYSSYQALMESKDLELAKIPGFWNWNPRIFRDICCYVFDPFERSSALRQKFSALPSHYLLMERGQRQI